MHAILRRHGFHLVTIGAMAAAGITLGGPSTPAHAAPAWKPGVPVVSYWSGPALTDAVAQQMAEGGFNLVWCTSEQELDIAQRHGLRAQFRSGLISPKSIDDPVRRQKLDTLLAQVRKHPALYSYFIRDEPAASDFAGLARVVDHLRARDPAHLPFINLFPTYATNEQLGTRGDTATAYRDYLHRYIETVKPSLLSYDHYQFAAAGDTDQYFLNLAMMRQTARQTGLPFMQVVQACAWNASMRVPNGDEMRYLVYTTLAYGAQGIGYYVYCRKNHQGGIALPDGTPTPLYHALKTLNREFVAIATQLQPLSSLEVYHAGMTPPGTVPLPNDAAFHLDPPIAPASTQGMKPVKGIVLGCFGPPGQARVPARPTHVLVVNLDYDAPAATTLRGDGHPEVFDASTGTWSSPGERAVLSLPPGGGRLVRYTTPRTR